MKIFTTTTDRMNKITTATNNNITRLLTALHTVATVTQTAQAQIEVSNTHLHTLSQAVHTLNNSGIKCIDVHNNIISTNNINRLVKAVYDDVTGGQHTTQAHKDSTHHTHKAHTTQEKYSYILCSDIDLSVKGMIKTCYGIVTDRTWNRNSVVFACEYSTHKTATSIINSTHATSQAVTDIEKFIDDVYKVAQTVKKQVVTTCEDTVTTQTAHKELSRKHIDFLAKKHAFFSVASALKNIIDLPVKAVTKTAQNTTPAHFHKLHRLNKKLAYNNINLHSMDVPTAVEIAQLQRKYNTLVGFLRFKSLNTNSDVITYHTDSTQTAHKDKVVYECVYTPVFDSEKAYKNGDKVNVRCSKYLSYKYVNQLVKAFCDSHTDSKKAQWEHSAKMLQNAKKKRLELKDFKKQVEKDSLLQLENSIKAEYGVTGLTKSTIKKLDLLKHTGIKKWDKISNKKLLKSCYNALDIIMKSAQENTSVINVSADVIKAHKEDFNNLLLVTTDSTQELDNKMLVVDDFNKTVKTVYDYFDGQTKSTRKKSDVLNADLYKKAKSVETLKKTFHKVIFTADFITNFVKSELSQGKTPQQALTNLFLLTLTTDGFVYGNVYNKNKDLYDRGTVVKEYVSYNQLTQKNDDNDLAVDFGSLEDFKTYKANSQIENKLYNLLTTENRFFKQAFFSTSDNKSLLDDEIQTVKVNLLDRFATCEGNIFKFIDFLCSVLTDRQKAKLQGYIDSNTDSNTDSTITSALKLIKCLQFYCGKVANNFINSLSAVSSQVTKYDSNGNKIKVEREGVIPKNHYIFNSDDVLHQSRNRFSLITKFKNENNLVNVKIETGNRLTAGSALKRTQYGMLLTALNKLLKFNYNQLQLMEQLIYSYSDDKGILSRIAQLKSGECSSHEKTKGICANLTRTKKQIQRKIIKGLCNDTTRKFIDDVVAKDNKNSVGVILLCKLIDTLQKSLDENTIHQFLTAK